MEYMDRAQCLEHYKESHAVGILLNINNTNVMEQRIRVFNISADDVIIARSASYRELLQSERLRSSYSLHSLAAT